MRPLARGDVFVICFIMKLLILLLPICTQTPVHRRCWPAHSIWKRSRPSRGARASALLLLQVRSGLSRQEVDAAMRECQDLLTILCFTGSTLLLLSLDRHFLTC